MTWKMTIKTKYNIDMKTNNKYQPEQNGSDIATEHSDAFLNAIRELETTDFLDADSKMLILVTANKTKPASEISINKIEKDELEKVTNTIESIFNRLGLSFRRTISSDNFDQLDAHLNIQYEIASSKENLERLIAAHSEENWIDANEKTGYAFGFPSTAIQSFIEQSRRGIWDISEKSKILSRIPEEERIFMSFVPSEQYFGSGEQDHVRSIIEATRTLSPAIYDQVLSRDRTSVIEQLKKEREAGKNP